MTALSEIPKMPDGTIIHELQGKLLKIEEVKTIPGKPDSEGKPTTFRAQAYFLEAPSNTDKFPLRLTTTRKEYFIGQELTGVLVRFITTAGSDGNPRGLVKTSYPWKGEQGVVHTSHKVVVGDGAIMSRVEIQPPPKPQAPTDPVLSIAREMRYCWDTIKKVAPAEFTLEMTKDWSTSLFIECQRKGVKFPIAAPSAPIPDQPVPLEGQKPKEPEPKPETPPSPKFSRDDLGTRVVGGLKITPSMLAGHKLDKVYDLCVQEEAGGVNAVPKEFLFSSFDAAKKRHKDETKLYTAILTHWQQYVADAKKLQQSKEDERAVEEMENAQPFD
jgi:hypothetical protein